MISRCVVDQGPARPNWYRAPRYDKTARAVFARGGQKLAAWMVQQIRDEDIAGRVPDVPRACLPDRLALGTSPCRSGRRGGGLARTSPARRARELEAPAGVDEDDDEEAAYRAALDTWRAGTAATTPDEADELPDEDA